MAFSVKHQTKQNSKQHNIMRTYKTLAISLVIGLLGYSVKADQTEYWKWASVYNCTPALPTAPVTDANKCSGFTTCTTTWTPNCPPCSVWEWLSWLCQCPTGYTSPAQTYQLVWKKTAESSTTTVTVSVGTPAPPKTVSGPVSVTVNGTVMWQYVVTVDYGICEIVAM
jgi:hypothetical protein